MSTLSERTKRPTLLAWWHNWWHHKWWHNIWPPQKLWQNKKVRQWLVIVATILLSAVIAYRGIWLLAVLLVAIVPAVVGVNRLSRTPAIGLILMAPAAMLVPFSIGTGSESRLNAPMLIVLGLTALWLLDMLTREKRIRLHACPTFLPLFVMLVMTLVAFVNGQLPWFMAPHAPITAQIGGTAIFVISVCAYLLAAHHFSDLRWVEWFTWIFVIFATGFIIIRLIPRLTYTMTGYYQIGSTASPFWFWLVAITCGQMLFNDKLRWYWRSLLGLILLATFYVSMIQTFDWASGWVPSVVTVAAILLLRWPRLAFLGGLAALPLLPLALDEILVVQEYSYSTRVDAWLIMLEIIKENPILGVGPANYYWYTPLFPIRGYYVEFNSHSQYFDIVAQIGIIGLLAYLWFLFQLGKLGLSLIDKVPTGFPRALIYCILGGLAGTFASGALGDWILPFVYNVGFIGMRASLIGWVFLGIIPAFAYAIDWDKEKSD
ncbi:MAG: O-antigen ligase family protein [Chloroflexota bacterium]